MKLKTYIVNFFTTKIAQGNPAGVVLLKQWLPDSYMIDIAKDIGKSETAFIIQDNDKYHIRWFTPLKEMPICGHATMAAVKVISKIYRTKDISFRYNGGSLKCSIDDIGMIHMDFPIDTYHFVDIDFDLIPFFNLDSVEDIIYGKKTKKLALIVNQDFNLSNLKPDFYRMMDYKGIYDNGIGISKTTSSNRIESRYFNPWAGVNEDYVTGSFHTMLFPYWSKKLQSKEIIAKHVLLDLES